jgi:YacP-like NYN domain
MIDPASPLLVPAVEAARRALREMEPEDVPASVHRVARSTARRLPPPLARSLAEALDENIWLRDKALEAWPEADPDHATPRQSASALFLLRPDGWEERVEEVVAAEEELSQAGTVEALRAMVERLQTELGSAREKAKAEGDRAELAETEAARAKSRARKKMVPAPASETTRRAEDVERRLADLQRELDEADERINRLREDLLKARRAARETPVAAPPSAFARRHPRETARLLDDLTAALRPAAGVGEFEPEPPAAPVALPTAIPPDKADAVDWLLKQTEPVTLVVDGYNLSFLLEQRAEFASPDARERLVARLTRLRRMAMAPMRVIAVFDTRNDPSSRRRRGGIEVHFAASGDDEVVRLAESIAGTVVAVSNDREVRERAAAFGAITLWSAAVAEWLRR